MKSLIHRRDSIILTTVEIINDLGIQGLSTREIAKRQEISEGTIFKHFKSKNEILLGVLEHFAKYDADIIDSINAKALKPIEAIKYFIKAFAEYYENYPEITAITQAYDVLACDVNLVDRVKDIVNIRSSFIVEQVEEGKRIGQIFDYVDSIGLSDVVTGFLSASCLRWRFSNYSFSLKKTVMDTLDMVLESYIVK